MHKVNKNIHRNQFLIFPNWSLAIQKHAYQYESVYGYFKTKHICLITFTHLILHYVIVLPYVQIIVTLKQADEKEMFGPKSIFSDSYCCLSFHCTVLPDKSVTSGMKTNSVSYNGWQLCTVFDG